MPYSFAVTFRVRVLSSKLCESENVGDAGGYGFPEGSHGANLLKKCYSQTFPTFSDWNLWIFSKTEQLQDEFQMLK